MGGTTGRKRLSRAESKRLMREVGELRSRIKSGVVDVGRVRLAAYLGNRAALRVVNAGAEEGRWERGLKRWMRGVAGFGSEAVTRAMVAGMWVWVEALPQRSRGGRAARGVLEEVEGWLAEGEPELGEVVERCVAVWEDDVAPVATAAALGCAVVARCEPGGSEGSRMVRLSTGVRVSRWVDRLRASGVEEVQPYRLYRAMCVELEPWALGVGDPARARVVERREGAVR